MTYKAQTLDEMTRSLAELFPNGLAWNQKNNINSNFNKLLRGLSNEFIRIQQQLEDFDRSYVPTLENLNIGTFLTNWAETFLIPDECFKLLFDKAETIQYLFAKITRIIILSSAQSYKDLAIYFGFVLTITYPAPHTIIFNVVGDVEVFPYTFPFPLGTESQDILECLYLEAIPAHIDLTINFT